MQQTVLVPLGRSFSDSNPLTNQKALCYVCVISPWEWWLKTPNSRMNEDHSPHSSFGAMFNQNQTQSETKHPSPVWHHDARSVPKKHSLFCYFWFPKKGFTGRIVENESFQWFLIFFFNLNVTDCNYKESINDQLGDGLRGRTNALKMWDAELCLKRKEACKFGAKKNHSSVRNTLKVPHVVMKSSKNSG